VKAVVLVGGEGTRLRPLTFTTPKPLLPVAGVPMLERILGHLVANGITEAVLSMGYRPDAIESAYPDGVCGGVAITYAVEPEPLDTAGGVAFAARHAGLDSTFLVLNGDVLSDIDLTGLLAFHKARGAEATIALTPVDDPSSFGVVPSDDEGRVTAFIEKPTRDEAPTNLINAGYYVVEPSLVERIPAGRRVNIERETFPLLVADRTLYALASDDYWTDTGTPVLYLEANLHALAGTTWFGPGARVDTAGAAVSASAVGARTTIGAGAEVIESVLLDDVTVEPGARVQRSLIGARSVIGADAVVEGLSVVGDGVRVAAGDRLVGSRVPEPA
jgi:mannose-1-phosphate guanylyltransferase